MDSITLGGGCFWCIESVLKQVDGVKGVISGYMGGSTINPTYEDVCRGDTNHAEVVKVEFDEKIISLEKLLKIFFTIHDPTTLNRQGNDVGTQYRSVIFYQDDVQKSIAQKVCTAKQETLADKIVTQIQKKSTFYKAEEYHQDFFAKNPQNGYCNFAIPPKLKKLNDMDY